MKSRHCVKVLATYHLGGKPVGLVSQGKQKGYELGERFKIAFSAQPLSGGPTRPVMSWQFLAKALGASRGEHRELEVRANPSGKSPHQPSCAILCTIRQRAASSTSSLGNPRSEKVLSISSRTGLPPTTVRTHSLMTIVPWRLGMKK